MLGAARAPTTTGMTRAPLVLLADDDDEAREGHASILREAGYEVVLARDGAEAVALAIARRPDVILMDLAMPGIDGWEATRRIRANLRTHRIPVIALTGHGLRRHVDRSVEAGCTAFVPKPCDRRPLLDAVARAVARRGPLGVVVDPFADVGSGRVQR